MIKASNVLSLSRNGNIASSCVGVTAPPKIPPAESDPPAATDVDVRTERHGIARVIDRVWKIAIIVLLVASISGSTAQGGPPLVFNNWLWIKEPVLRAGLLLAGVVYLFYFCAQLYHALRYRPVPDVADKCLPSCTVVVPAYNEGPMVRVSLLSALASRYPKDRLRVIVVDDGSTDDTWSHIEAVAREFPSQVTPVRLPRNGGKREALRQGFLRATGEAVVTVDSDSRLEHDSIRNAVAPLVNDPEVGAVAGRVMVLNRYENSLTRLLAARFSIMFDLVRAAQSRFGAVLCCPGALTVYRRSAVLEVLPRWSTQTFLGAPCTIGEDRALTVWLLRAGYRTVYQSTAEVHTLVPASVMGTVRMLLRWSRGDVREDLVMLPVLFTRWRARDRWWPTLETVLSMLQWPIVYGAMVAGCGHVFFHPTDLLRLIAVTGIFALVQSLYSLRSERSTDFLYGVGYAFVASIGLQWLFPYSCLTIRNGRWLTR